MPDNNYAAPMRWIMVIGDNHRRTIWQLAPEETAQPINIQITSHVTVTSNYELSAHTKEARLNEPSQVKTISQQSVAFPAEQTNKEIHLWPNGRCNISIVKHFSFLHQKLPLSRSSSISSIPLYICLTNLKSQIRNSKSFILNQFFFLQRRNSHPNLKGQVS